MERLFDPDAPYFATWVWIYDIDRPWKGSMATVRPPQPDAKPLYYAALCGFRGLIEHLTVTHQVDVNAWGGDHGTALNAALARGELEIARALLQNGADVNAVDSAGSSSLYRAAEAGHRAVVELLLEHKADVNIQTESSARPRCMGGAGWGTRHLSATPEARGRCNVQRRRGWTRCILRPAMDILVLCRNCLSTVPM
jgi:hypothetical protein